MFNTYDPTRPYDNQMGYSLKRLKKFWSNVNVINLSDGSADINVCWIWTAGCYTTGYGQFEKMGAHRFSWQSYNGPAPKFNEKHERLCIRHKICNNRACVNPTHLMIGTYQQNSDDMVEADRQARGSIHGMSELSDEETLEILELSRKGMTVLEITNEFDISKTAIHNIISGYTRGHITGIKYNPEDHISKVVLDIDKAREIRAKLKLGRTTVSLGLEYGVHRTVISKIKLNQIWKDI